ncbi:MAG: helix-turn-helix transcriptional regulator [Actinomycetota bacterium]|nr:helix-turn-helix transcriptional regulator [Actinomycetota bacterium]
MSGRLRGSRIAEGVAQLSAAGVDDRVLRGRILDVVRRAVPFDAYAFLLTDPDTCVGCSPLAEVPDLAVLPDLIRLKYLTAVNRWTTLPPDGCHTLLRATAGEPGQSRLWRELLDCLGVVDVLSAVFRDRHGCWGFLDLWRLDGPFADDEASALSHALPRVTALLRGVQAAAFVAECAPAAQRGPGALVLSPDLAVRAQTSQTSDWLSALVPPEAGRGPVPAGAYNVSAQLLAVEAGVDAHPAQARVHLGGGSWLTLRADRLAGDGPVAQRDVVVTMETSSAAERRDVFSRACALSSREDELLGHLVEGHDTHTVARSMAISELTVQDHLKSVFAKTSTSSRRELLARSLGR